MIVYGQIVIGAPGSGKTSYCHAIAQHLSENGRKVILLNLDPAVPGCNQEIESFSLVDIRKYFKLEDVMEKELLGPNGAIMFCLENINSRLLMEDILDILRGQNQPDFSCVPYLMIDCPGQIELYTHSSGFYQLIHSMTTEWKKILDLRLCCVHLVDSYMCCNAASYVAGVLLSLQSMLQFELPHTNILTKIDLLKTHFGNSSSPYTIVQELEDDDFILPFKLDEYLNVPSSGHLLDHIFSSDESHHGLHTKYKKLTEGILSLIEDYPIVAFHPLSLLDSHLVSNIISIIDKANGFVYRGEWNSSQNITERDIRSTVGLFTVADSNTFQANNEQVDRNHFVMDIQERYSI